MGRTGGYGLESMLTQAKLTAIAVNLNRIARLCTDPQKLDPKSYLWKSVHKFSYNNFFIFSSNKRISSVGSNLSTTLPLRSIRNFVKFHLILGVFS